MQKWVDMGYKGPNSPALRGRGVGIGPWGWRRLMSGLFHLAAA